MKSIGSAKSDTAKTPTLRQWWKSLDGEKTKEVHTVKIVFVPNKYKTYTLVTDTDFRVSVQYGNPIYEWLEQNFNDVINNEVCLGVHIDDGEKGHWSLVDMEATRVDWEEHAWGIIGTIKQQPRPTGKKAPRPSGSSSVA